MKTVVIQRSNRAAYKTIMGAVEKLLKLKYGGTMVTRGRNTILTVPGLGRVTIVPDPEPEPDPPGPRGLPTEPLD